MVNSLFGQYSYRDTIIHKLDPRTKILLLIIISMLLFMIKSYISFIPLSIFILFIVIISKIKLTNILRNLRPFLFFFAFIFLMYLFFSREELPKGIIAIWRFTLLIIIASILTFSTTISQLVNAIERLFSPLRLFKISPRNIAVMVSATIRFIPLLFSETGKIRDAQKSRGANLKRVKHLIGFANALIRKTFDKASNLADAMESRCYRDYGYSHFNELKLGARDYASGLFTILVLGGVLWI